MAGSLAKDPGRLRLVIFILSLLTVAFLLTLINHFWESSRLADNDETIVSESARPEVDSISDGAMPTGDTGSGADTITADTTIANASGAPITVFTGQDSGDSTPPSPGVISGVVSTVDGSPLSGVAVILFRVDGSRDGIIAATGVDGGFYMAPAPGQYKLFFSHPSGDYQSAWYGGYAPGSAAVVTVSSAQEVTIAQSLNRTTAGGSLAGTARDQNGAAVAGVNVFAFLFINRTCLNGPCDALELKGNAVTDSKGAYQVNGLDAGSYKVMFSPAGTDLSVQWYIEQSTHETAKTVVVETGKTVTGVDASLYRGGTISGNITRQGGAPAAYALVDAYDDTGIIVYSGLADASGNYQTAPLPDGNYRIHAATNMPGGWEDEWYSDKQDFASAEAVTVNRYGSTSGINFEIGSKSLPIPDDTGHDKVIIIQEDVGVVAGGEGTAGADAIPASSDASGGEAASQVADQVALPDKYQQDVVSNGSDDHAMVGQVERDDAPLG